MGLPGNVRTRPQGEFARLRKYRIGDDRVICTRLGFDTRILRIGNRTEGYKGELGPGHRNQNRFCPSTVARGVRVRLFLLHVPSVVRSADKSRY